MSKRVRKQLAGGAIACALIIGGGTVWAQAAPITEGMQRVVSAATAASEYTALEVASMPTTTIYAVGSAFDSSGLVINGVKADGGKQKLQSEEYTLSGFNSNTPGSSRITVSLVTDAKITTTFSVAVVDTKVPSDNMLTNGSFESGTPQGWDVTYAVGSGANVVGQNTNGVQKSNAHEGSYGFNFWDKEHLTQASAEQTVGNLPKGWYEFKGYAEGNAGEASGTIYAKPTKQGKVSGKFTGWTHDVNLAGGEQWDEASTRFYWGGGSIALGFNVTMKTKGGWVAFDDFSLTRTAPANEVTGIVASAVKDTYTVGETVKQSGFAVRKVMSDGTTFRAADNEWTLSPVDTSSAGKKDVTVSYAAKPELSATTSVTVVEPQDYSRIAKLVIASLPERSTIRVGRDLNVRGLVVAGYDTKGNYQGVVPGSEYTISGFDGSRAGKQTVTVTLKANPKATASFDVSVVEPQGVYTITDLTQSSGDGVVTVKQGAATVDLTKVANANTVTIAKNVASAGLTSLTFAEHAGSVLDVTVEDRALAQESSPTLTSVTFPQTLDTLTVGKSAFFQYASHGATALKTVVFPEQVYDLVLGGSSFRQDAQTVATLATVSFPESAHAVTIGEQAFRQKFGTEGALHHVTLPGSVGSLHLGYRAFSASPSYRASGGVQTIFVNGDGVTKPSGSTVGDQIALNGSPTYQRAVSWSWSGAATLAEALGVAADQLPGDIQEAAQSSPGHSLRYDGNDADSTVRATGVPAGSGYVPTTVGAATMWSQTVTNVAPVRAGYTFAGWNTKADGTGAQYQSGDTIVWQSDTESSVLYAQWKADPSTVTFDANGGVGNADKVQGETGSMFTLPDASAFTYAGRTLAGWSANADGTGMVYAPASMQPLPAGNVTFYAVWQGGTQKPDNTPSPEEPQAPAEKPVNNTDKSEAKKPNTTVARTGASVAIIAGLAILGFLGGSAILARRKAE